MGKAARSGAPQPRTRERSQTGRIQTAPATRRRLNHKTRPRSAVATPSDTDATVSSAVVGVSNASATVSSATVSSESATVLDAAARASNTGATVSTGADAVPRAARTHGSLLDVLEAAEGAGEPAATASSMPFAGSPGGRSSEVPCWSGVFEEENVLRRLAQGVVADLPDETLARVLSNMQNFQESVNADRPLRIGSIYTGSDLAKHAWDEFLLALLGPGARCLQTEHTMGVERVEWKRQYIQQNHPGLRFLFGEAAQLQEPTGYCFLHGKRVPWPHCDVLSVGSSCTDFSNLRGHLSRSSARDVLEGTGASGSTLRFAMTYIDTHRPAVLLLENVVGLFKGFLKKDPVTWKLLEDTFSNLSILLHFLRRAGYCAPRGVANPAPRLPSNRRRAWLPCFLIGTDCDSVRSGSCDSLLEAAHDLFEHLQGHASLQIAPESLRMTPHTPEHVYWLKCAVDERPARDAEPGAAAVPSGTKAPKYRDLHLKEFQRSGLLYPPQFSQNELALAREMRMTTREAEVLYYLDRVRPMMHEHCEESFCDLGQSINRCRLSISDTVPCITPSGRLWKRRAREWLLAPEAMLAQGYDPAYVPCLTDFSHRQIVNLMGNAFNSSSYLVALATALGTASLETRQLCSSGDAVPQSPSADLVSALDVGNGCGLEADLVRLLKADGVLLSESEGEISD